MLTTEQMVLDLVDRLGADPRAQIDPRAWKALLTYVPLGLGKRPVAFRYKNGNDQWVYTSDEAETQRALDSGHDSQALFIRMEEWDQIHEIKRRAYLDQRKEQ